MHNLKDLQQQIHLLEIQYHRPKNSVQLLAVSKKQPIEAIQALHNSGQQAFGESTLQEALSKISALQDKNLSWHFIGPIQSNKIPKIARFFDWVHSVDSLAIAEGLNHYRPPHLPPLSICLQVNIDEAPQKRGIPPFMDTLLSLVNAIQQLPHLKLQGLMTLPNPRPSATFSLEQQRVPFRRLASLAAQLSLNTLSMGMSDDMEAAIAEGATIVRIGTALFK